MARIPRPNLPGSAFHLTTRLQDRAHRFTGPVRDRVVRALARHLARADVRLLAFVVMTNHLHLVVVQGMRPLDRFSQPFLTSVARSVQAAHHLEGHVFERRYRDHVCTDDEHLRNAIAYTHANPVRAGLCDDPGDYRWSSHRLYDPRRRPCKGGGAHVPVDVGSGLEAFGAGLRAGESYLDCLATILGAPPAAEEESVATLLGPTRSCRVPPRDDRGRRRPPADEELAAIAAEILEKHPHHSLETVRARRGSRDRYAIRAEIALAGVQADFTGRQVAWPHGAPRGRR